MQQAAPTLLRTYGLDVLRAAALAAPWWSSSCATSGTRAVRNRMHAEPLGTRRRYTAEAMGTRRRYTAEAMGMRRGRIDIRP